MPINQKNQRSSEELRSLFAMMHVGKNFAFSRFGDGEMRVLRNEPYSATGGEFTFTPDDPNLFLCRELLWESFQHNDPNYFVGIRCPHCFRGKLSKFDDLRDFTGLPDSQLTFANMFVDGNYKLFKEYAKKVLPQKKIITVRSMRGKNVPFPFKTEKEFFVSNNAWIKDLVLIKKIQNYIRLNNIEDHIFLLQAGPFANILAYKLWESNPENTYIDIGSTFDPEIGLGKTRGYLRGSYKQAQCYWVKR